MRVEVSTNAVQRSKENSLRIIRLASQRRGHLRWNLSNRIFIARDGSLNERGKFEQKPSKEESGEVWQGG